MGYGLYKFPHIGMSPLYLLNVVAKFQMVKLLMCWYSYRYGGRFHECGGSPISVYYLSNFPLKYIKDTVYKMENDTSFHYFNISIRTLLIINSPLLFQAH